MDITRYFIFSPISNGRFLLSLGEKIKIIIVDRNMPIANANSIEFALNLYSNNIIKYIITETTRHFSAVLQ